MTAHTPLRHLFPGSVHSATTGGHTLGAPRFYDIVAEVFISVAVGPQLDGEVAAGNWRVNTWREPSPSC